MDYNNMSNEELIEQFPGLYQKMSEFVRQIISGKSPDVLLKSLEIMQNATIIGGDFYDMNGHMFGSLRVGREDDIDVNSISDELLQELFAGYGVDDNGEIRRNEGAKNQVMSIAESMFNK